VLALGLAASMVLIAATTEFEGEIFGIKVKKGAASADIIKNLAALFGSVLPAGKD
jgi:hypothetical protein